MADKKQKFKALDSAIKIAIKYARGGGNFPPSKVVKDSYKQIVEIIDEIEQAED